MNESVPRYVLVIASGGGAYACGPSGDSTPAEAGTQDSQGEAERNIVEEERGSLAEQVGRRDCSPTKEARGSQRAAAEDSLPRSGIVGQRSAVALVRRLLSRRSESLQRVS